MNRATVLPAAAVLVVGVLASTSIALLLDRSERSTAERAMDRRVNLVHTAAASEVERHVQAVQLIAAALSAQPDVTASGFTAATAPLPTMGLSGAAAVGFVVPATDGRVRQVESYWRARGADGLQLQPASVRDEHLFVVFQRGLGSTTLRRAGIDLTQAAEPTEAMQRARRTGQVAVSRPYRLLTDRSRPIGQQQASFSISTPVYATGPGSRPGPLRGWVAMGLRGQDFMAATLDRAARDLGRIDLLAQTGTGWQPVASAGPEPERTDLSRQVLLPIGDTLWRLDVRASRAALPGGQTHLGDGLLVTGLLLTFLLTALVGVLATGRRRAHAEVERATAGLRAAEAGARHQADLLTSVLDNISDGVGVVNERGEFLLHNPAARRILGVAEDVAGPENWQEHYGVFLPDGVTPFPADRMPVVRALGGEAVDNVEMVIRNPANPDGISIDVSARPLSSGDGGAAVSVFHDVTEAKRSARRLRASEQRLQLLLDGARDYAIIMLGPDGTVASWSGNAERIIGYTEQEVLGLPYERFFPPEAVAAGEPAQVLSDAARQGRVEVEGVRLRRDGSRYWAHWVVTALTGEDGTLRGFVKVSQDVTARRGAEDRFRDLLESAPDAMLGTDADGRIILVNSKVEQLFGYPRDELLGRPVEILVPEPVRDLHARHRAGYLRRPVARPMGSGEPLWARRKDGTTFPVEISLSTLDSVDGVLVSTAIRDISDRIAAQVELRELNDRLQHLNQELEHRVAARTRELASRTEQLARQTEQLAAANEELEAFSYSVSHDLRAPLRAVDGFANVLAKGYADRLDDTGRRYLAKVRAGAQQMGELIDGLLAFSRLQRQVMSRQPVSLRQLAAEVWEELAVDRADRDVSLRLGDLPDAHGDPRLLRHVLGNLLGNAVKYTGGRAHAEVTVDSYRDEAGQPVYLVRDNGTGFDMRYADKLFKVFQRLHRSEDYEGTGIGLALTARIVQRHGGRIWADAEPDRGATFYFTIPAVDSGGAPTGKDDHESESGPGFTRGGQPERRGAGPARV